MNLINPKEPKLVGLLTDFQTQDWYVGVMKAVMMGIEPELRCLDISHQIPPQDICAASFVLQQAYREFPPGSIFLVVVDPGVGTERKPIVLRAGEYFFVGPDNGIFGFLEDFHPRDFVSHELRPFWQNQPLRSNTFHGRDLFAPACAHLARGTPLEKFGPPLPQLKKWDFESQDTGKVVYIDYFGNAITNIPGKSLTDSVQGFKVGNHEIPRARTYGEVDREQPLALIGSTGFLEIAVNQGHAASVLELQIGDPVIPV